MCHAGHGVGRQSQRVARTAPAIVSHIETQVGRHIDGQAVAAASRAHGNRAGNCADGNAERSVVVGQSAGEHVARNGRKGLVGVGDFNELIAADRDSLERQAVVVPGGVSDREVPASDVRRQSARERVGHRDRNWLVAGVATSSVHQREADVTGCSFCRKSRALEGDIANQFLSSGERSVARSECDHQRSASCSARESTDRRAAIGDIRAASTDLPCGDSDVTNAERV